MSIFTKKTKKTAETEPKKVKVAVARKSGDKDAVSMSELASVLVRPHVTEKAALLAEKNTYVFEVAPHSNKITIAKAVSALYGVKPIRVNIINLPRTRALIRGKMGVKAGVRKALVTLGKGDKIELI
ncbi:MAG: 50S ribosomal protein L23 [Patescibacteria group bacterium]